MEKALDVLKPPMEKDDVTDHLVPWLNDLRLSQNAIDTILSLPPHNKMLEDARFIHILHSLYSLWFTAPTFLG